MCNDDNNDNKVEPKINVMMQDHSCSRHDCFENRSHQLIAFIYPNKTISPIIALVGLDVCAYHANLEEIDMLTPYIKPQMQKILSLQKQLEQIDLDNCYVAYHWIPLDTLDLSKAGEGHYKGRAELQKEFKEANAKEIEKTITIGECADKKYQH